MEFNNNTILFEGPFQPIEIIPCENGKQVLDEFKGNGITSDLDEETGRVTYFKLDRDELEVYLEDNEDKRSYEDALDSLFPHLNLEREGAMVKALHDLTFLNGRVTELTTELVGMIGFKLILKELGDIIPEINREIIVIGAYLYERDDMDKFLVSVKFDTENESNGFTVCLNGCQVRVDAARNIGTGCDPVKALSKNIKKSVGARMEQWRG